MAYNEFSLERLIRQFSLHIAEPTDHFAAVSPAPISPWLRETLEAQIPLAISLSTEKARSEFIIAPVLMEVKKQLDNKVSLFSGVEFNVDDKAGLRGVCDFLFSVSPLQIIVEAPVVSIVEAKNENIKSGISQCIAEMVAAERFNKSKEAVVLSIYGVVTIGTQWRFLEYSEGTVYIDTMEYSILNVEKIIGIFLHMLQSATVGYVIRERKAKYSVL